MTSKRHYNSSLFWLKDKNWSMTNFHFVLHLHRIDIVMYFLVFLLFYSPLATTHSLGCKSKKCVIASSMNKFQGAFSVLMHVQARCFDYFSYFHYCTISPLVAVSPVTMRIRFHLFSTRVSIAVYNIAPFFSTHTLQSRSNKKKENVKFFHTPITIVS